MRARGWCNAHYQRWHTKGDLGAATVRLRSAPPFERLMSHVDKQDDGCWIWTAALDRAGYGRTEDTSQRRKVAVHRFMYELLVGPIPDGLQIDHLCRVRACCNPAHLEPVTSAENTRRGEPAQRTHCPSGHLYDRANTYVYAGNGRHCRACNRAAQRRRKARTEAAR